MVKRPEESDKLFYAKTKLAMLVGKRNLPLSSFKRIYSERTFSMVRKIVTENRTSLHNDAVCTLLSCKLNCDRSAAGFKRSKVRLNAAKKATYKHNQPHKSKSQPRKKIQMLSYGWGGGKS